MKHNFFRIIIASCFIAIGCLVSSCQEDEELNLIGFPENSVSMNVDDTSILKITASYDSEGKLLFSSPLKKNWTVSLKTPSPKDVSIVVTPHIVNIPQENVSLSGELVKIPAGFISADVELGFVNDDLSFMENNLAAETYELGISVSDAQGLNLNTEMSMGKMIIEKEKYTSNVSIEGGNGNSVQFKKVCINDGVMGEPISYSFKIALDKPAKEEIKVNLVTEGIPEGYENTASFTPSSVIIPAGEKESEEISWAVSDDLMKAYEGDGTFNVALKAQLEESEYATLTDNSAIAIEIIKTSSILELLNGLPMNWNVINRNQWNVELGAGWYGNGPDLIDDDPYYSNVYFVEMDSSEGELVIDMNETQDIVGISTAYGYTYAGGVIYYMPIKIELLTSNDKIQWNSLGTLTLTKKAGNHFIELIAPTQARYVKYKATVNSDLGMIQLFDLRIYNSSK